MELFPIDYHRLSNETKSSGGKTARGFSNHTHARVFLMSARSCVHQNSLKPFLDRGESRNASLPSGGSREKEKEPKVHEV